MADQKAEIEALKPKPPPAPFVDKPHQRYDPTEGMSMPRSALEAMIAAEPRGFMHDVALRDARAPNTSAMIPNQPSNRGGDVREPLRGYSSPLSNPPGTGPGSQADKIVDEFDRRDRAELARRLGKG